MKESNIKINLSKNTISEIKDTLSNQKTNINSMVKLKEYTPKQLVDAGVSNLPMLVRKGHLRENILTIQEAQIKGFSTKGKHYHGLGIETYIKMLETWWVAALLHLIIIINTYFILSGEKYYNEDVGAE